MKSTTHVILRIPVEAWATLEETLYMDAESSAFTPDLRDEIATALAQVEDITESHERATAQSKTP